MIKCIAIDMDGTLLTAAQQITPENLEAIRRAQSKGVEVVIATGRSYTEASFVLDAEGLICPMICVNGAEIRSANKEIVATNSLEKSTARKITAILDRYRLYFEVYTNKGTFTLDEEKAVSIMVDIYMSANPEADVNEVMKVAEKRITKGLVHKVESYDLLFNNDEHQIYKLLAFSFEQDILSEAKRELLKVEGLAISSSGEENLELTSINAQKGIALEKFAQANGIDMKDTMAIGDNYNDLSMFNLAGLSVAMGNADEVIKAQCDKVTLTNEESGVAKAIWDALEGVED
ncbi:Cof-type HAD-IIB family hydrolase [Cytobacillus solani]|uniref:Hydrolase n=1 Tax=Cytobacillus solani TaxID=1637975 RepID=A0A0Q3QUY0_9BACI|nr:Cof-type HAD-IIB family hydrolase [Cytobacillus solani]KOP71735.1 hydrolase [Bacillus sp. FJAT-21945]KQL21590.1 hydrolase [Cytobacillus solani]USK54900.1 Cof-type HAD-IIB family hydrolase [Cytobacillus solani]